MFKLNTMWEVGKDKKGGEGRKSIRWSGDGRQR